MPHTLLAFHAHPDDEALLTSGTMARAAAEGHRVVLVVATDGGEGLASAKYTAESLATRRMDELETSARALGVARVEYLGYADSGLGPRALPDPPRRTRFVRADTHEAAARLATILAEEAADVLLTYDPNGGYGHPDHIKAHEVGMRAAALAGTRRVLQATVPRDAICRAIDLAAKVYRFPPEFDRGSFDRAFSARRDITHRINVRRHITAKRASMRAHASQASSDGGADRTLAAFLRIPRPLFDLVFGTEWYVDATAEAHGSCTLDHDKRTLDHDKRTLDGEKRTLDHDKRTLDGEKRTLDGEECTLDGEECTLDQGGKAATRRSVRSRNPVGGIRRDVFEGLA